MINAVDITADHSEAGDVGADVVVVAGNGKDVGDIPSPISNQIKTNSNQTINIFNQIEDGAAEVTQTSAHSKSLEETGEVEVTTTTRNVTKPQTTNAIKIYHQSLTINQITTTITITSRRMRSRNDAGIAIALIMSSAIARNCHRRRRST